MGTPPLCPVCRTPMVEGDWPHRWICPNAGNHPKEKGDASRSRFRPAQGDRRAHAQGSPGSGITQEELARRSYYSRPTIVNFEAGRQDMPVTRIALLAFIVGTDLERLFKGTSVLSVKGRKDTEMRYRQEAG